MKRTKRKVVSRRRNNKRAHSLVLGVVHDILWIVKIVCSVISWPVKQVANIIKKQLHRNRTLRKFRYTHEVVCIGLGLAILGVAFALESLSSHPLWGMSIETMRAAGVCPIWETLAAVMKIGEDVG